MLDRLPQSRAWRRPASRRVPPSRSLRLRRPPLVARVAAVLFRSVVGSSLSGACGGTRRPGLVKPGRRRDGGAYSHRGSADPQRTRRRHGHHGRGQRSVRAGGLGRCTADRPHRQPVPGRRCPGWSLSGELASYLHRRAPGQRSAQLHVPGSVCGSLGGGGWAHVDTGTDPVPAGRQAPAGRWCRGRRRTGAEPGRSVEGDQPTIDQALVGMRHDPCTGMAGWGHDS